MTQKSLMTYAVPGDFSVFPPLQVQVESIYYFLRQCLPGSVSWTLFPVIGTAVTCTLLGQQSEFIQGLWSRWKLGMFASTEWLRAKATLSTPYREAILKFTLMSRRALKRCPLWRTKPSVSRAVEDTFSDWCTIWMGFPDLDIHLFSNDGCL